MIFDCGESWEAKRERLENWHPFFTLLPRTVESVNGRDICAWLQIIERKGEWDQEGGYYWEYRAKHG